MFVMAYRSAKILRRWECYSHISELNWRGFVLNSQHRVS